MMMIGDPKSEVLGQITPFSGSFCNSSSLHLLPEKIVYIAQYLVIGSQTLFIRKMKGVLALFIMKP
jgi:hypothetical protein